MGRRTYPSGVKISLAMMAKRLGVSRNAVHLALSGKPGLSDSMRKKITGLAAELGHPAAGPSPLSLTFLPNDTPAGLKEIFWREGFSQTSSPGGGNTVVHWKRDPKLQQRLRLKVRETPGGPAVFQLAWGGSMPDPEDLVWAEVAVALKNPPRPGFSFIWLLPKKSMGPEGKVSAAKLAKELGLSPSAVSMALRGKPGVSAPVREAVLRLGRRWGYPGLVPANPVVLLLHQIPQARLGNWYPLCGNIEGAARDLGWVVTMVEHLAPEKNLENLARDTRVKPDLVVAVAHTRQWFDRAREAFGQVPLMGIGFEGAAWEGVGEDLAQGMKGVLRLAADDPGARQVAYLSTWRQGHFMEKARHEIFLQVATGRGWVLSDPWVALIPVGWDDRVPYEDSDHGIYFDHRAFCEKVDTWVSRLPKQGPDLLVCYNDRTARVAAETFERHRRKLPKMVGWDLNPAEWSRPSPTLFSVRPDVPGMCKALVFLAKRRMDQPTAAPMEVRVAASQIGTLPVSN